MKITHSSSTSFKVCRRKFFFEYEMGLRRTVDAKPLRMGTAWHNGLDALKQGRTIDEAATVARDCYQSIPDGFDAADWEMERETIVAMLAGYAWRWSDPFKVIATEQAFNLPMVNPETNSASKLFQLAGKIDGIIEWDGRLLILEHKTVSEDIALDGDYWRRLQMDSQVSIYTYAARQLGYDVSGVLWDAARKPTIKPTAVPVLDDLGAKIVLDARGNRVKTAKGDWRQTGSTAEGYVLQTRPMTPEEWGNRVLNDITERPEHYFARVEIARLDQDITEAISELWDLQKSLREAQRQEAWYRTVTSDTCPWCAYFGICGSRWQPDQPLPEGFSFLADVHPELTM